ncbi:MAG: DUF948 domain-containing protein [Patescibacteria group bacterium]
MQDFWKADIFFVVTTFAVIFAAVVFIVLAFYALVILKEIRLLVARLRAETDQLADDLHATRDRISNEGWLTVMMGQWNKYKRRQPKSEGKVTK